MYLQVKLEKKEKVEMEKVVKKHGFRSLASFAYYALVQQYNDLATETTVEDLGLTEEQLKSIKEALDEDPSLKRDFEEIRRIN